MQTTLLTCHVRVTRSSKLAPAWMSRGQIRRDVRSPTRAGLAGTPAKPMDVAGFHAFNPGFHQARPHRWCPHVEIARDREMQLVGRHVVELPGVEVALGLLIESKSAVALLVPILIVPCWSVEVVQVHGEPAARSARRGYVPSKDMRQILPRLGCGRAVEGKARPFLLLKRRQVRRRTRPCW